MLALHATKDTRWEQVLQSDDAEKAIEALELEMASLMSTILTDLGPNGDFRIRISFGERGCSPTHRNGERRRLESTTHKERNL
jgi:hypothetical protein